MRARGKFILEGGRPSPTTYHVRRRDGSVVQLEVSSGPCEFEGRPAVLTVRPRRERAQGARGAADPGRPARRHRDDGRRRRARDQQPLGYVMLNLDWIARKLPESAGDPASMGALIELLHEAHRGAERVASIVRELRTFSRADGETRHRVDLAAVARSAIEDRRPRDPPPRAGVDVVRAGAAGLGQRVAARAGRAQPAPQRGARDARGPGHEQRDSRPGAAGRRRGRRPRSERQRRGASPRKSCRASSIRSSRPSLAGSGWGSGCRSATGS